MHRLATTLALAALALSPTIDAQEPERPWTLMVYGAADNNADGPILEFLDSIRQAKGSTPGMELILFIDRSDGFSNDATTLGADFTGARIYRLLEKEAELLNADDYFPGMSEEEEYEVDSSDPRNVADFVAFCKERFPARNYGLMIYSHADGCTMCPDEESGGHMAIPQSTDEVGRSESVDFLALELCNMGGIEIAYQWRPGNGGFSADVLVAIPNAGPPLDWDRAFARLRAGEANAVEASSSASLPPFIDPARLTPLDFGRLVIEEGHRGRLAMQEAHPDFADQLGHEAAACYDLTRAAAVKEAVDSMARALAASSDKEIFEDLRGPGPDGNVVLNYVRDSFGSRPYVDLFDLARRAAACEELSGEVRTAAREVARRVDDFVVASFGMQGFAAFEPGRHGVFIVFPDGDAKDGRLGERMWRNLDWYTPLSPADFIEGSGAPYGRWAFLADGATPDNGEVENWFELLDAWFDDTSSDPGGYNHYVW